MLRLCTEFQCPTMPGTGPKVCVCGDAVGLKPILVFSFGQAEQNTFKTFDKFCSA